MPNREFFLESDGYRRDLPTRRRPERALFGRFLLVCAFLLGLWLAKNGGWW